MTEPGAPARPADAPRRRPAFLPSAIDPTVFDEGFLRQLERLLLVTRRPVRGGLKGVRRSTKRGISVEFADYRDYALGDDLRQLDWNIYARLERLFIKLFVPNKLLFAKRAAAALAYVGLASYDRVSVAVLQGRVARRFPAVRGKGRIFQVMADLSRAQAAPGPSDLQAAARHYAAQVRARGPLILISDLFDPAAAQAIGELAGTRSEVVVLHVLAPDEIDPPLAGELRLLDAETAAGLDITADLGTLDAYKRRLAAWRADLEQAAAKRRATYVPLDSTLPLADLVFAELRRRRVLG